MPVAVQFDEDTTTRAKQALSAGADPNEVLKEAQKYQASKRASSYKFDPAPEKKKGNLFTSKDSIVNITNLAGIAGSIGGGLVAGPAGAVAGGVTASAAGETLRQKLNDEETDVKEIGKQGVIGGASEFGGQLLGKILGVGAKTVGKGLAKEGENLAVKSLKTTDAQLAKFAERHGETVPELMQRLKLVGGGAQEIEDKAIKPLQESFDAITNKSGVTVDPDTLVKNFQDAIDEFRASPATQNKALADKLEQEFLNIIDSSGKGPLDISKLNKFRKQYDVVTKDFAADAEKSSANRRVGSILRKTAQETADAAGLSGPNGESLKEMGTELNKLYDLHGTALKNSFKGQSKSVLGVRDMVFAGGGGLAGGLPGAAAAAIGSRLADNPKVLAFLSKTATKTGSMVPNIAIPQALLSAGSQSAARTLATGQQPQREVPAMPQDLSFSMPDTGTVQKPSAGSNPFSDPDTVAKIMLADLMATGGKYSGVLQNIAKVSEQAKPKEKTLSEGDKKFALAEQEASKALQLLDTSGVKTGKIANAASTVTDLLGTTGKNVTALKSQIASARTAVKNALLGANMSPSEIKSIEDSLFDYSQPPQVLKQRLEVFVQSMSDYRNNIAGGGDSSQVPASPELVSF